MNDRIGPARRYRNLAKCYQEAIRHILLREWDPIGVADEPAAADEYDGYIPKIHGMLMRRAPRHRLVEHLSYIENQCMGLVGDRERTEAAADRLMELRDKIDVNP